MAEVHIQAVYFTILPSKVNAELCTLNNFLILLIDKTIKCWNPLISEKNTLHVFFVLNYKNDPTQIRMGSAWISLGVAFDFIALTDNDKSDGDRDNDDNGSQDETPEEVS